MSDVDVKAYPVVLLTEQYFVIEGTNQSNSSVEFNSWGFDLPDGRQMFFMPNQGGTRTDPFWSDPIAPGAKHKFFIPFASIREGLLAESVTLPVQLTPKMKASGNFYYGTPVEIS